MITKHSVFVSSTFLGLEVTRGLVAKELLKHDCIPVGMDINFYPTSSDKIEYIKEMLKNCDYCVLVLGSNYGSIIDSGDFKGISYTHMEYKYALENDIPVLPLIAAKDCKIPGVDIDSLPRERDSENLTMYNDFRRELEKNGGEIWSDQASLISLLGVGINNIKKQCPRSGWQRHLEPTSLDKLVKSRGTRKFFGFHYSFKKHEIVQFEFRFKITKKYGTEKNIDLELVGLEKGLHDETSEGGMKYLGHGYKRGYFVYFNLFRGNKQTDQLNIILQVDATPDLKNKKIILGSCTGTSASQNHIISLEAVFVDQAYFNKNEHIKNEIERYLFSKRYFFRIPQRQHSKIEDLKIKGRHSTKRAKALIGVYRVWGVTRQGHVIQNKLHFNEAYNVELRIPLLGNNEDHHVQICLVNFTEQNGFKVCLTTYPKESAQLLNYVILKPPSNPNFKFMTGTFCSIGITSKDSVAGYVVLMKDARNFEPAFIHKNDIDGVVESENLTQLWNKLKKLLNEHKHVS